MEVVIMHPILYPPGEKDFLDNGLTVLTDCTKCLVTEERNGAYTLEMQYPANGRHYDLIAEDCILLAKPTPDDEPQPFRLYKADYVGRYNMVRRARLVFCERRAD